jgi:sec-independent protein translocase protein TatB
MFDIGFSELMLIGIVALIVIGPKELPGLFHTLGRFTARARQLGREFNRAMNDAAKESGVDDIAKGLKNVANPKKMGLDGLNKAAERFEKWDPSKGGKPPEKPLPKPSDDPEKAAERAADVAKIRATTERMGRAKLDREAAAKVAAADVKPKGEAASTAPEQPEQAPAKKPASKKPVAKEAAAKPAAKKPAAKKPSAKPKATAAKPADTKAPAKATTRRKPAANKPAARPTKAASE